MSGALTRAECLAMDRQDPLAALRERFHLPDGVIYLDGNSLGALPKQAVARVDRAVREEWGRGLIRSWNDAGWYPAPSRVGAKIARLIGAAADEVVVCDSTSVNLFKVLVAACRLRPGRRVILSEQGNFPTNLYVGAGAAELMGAELRRVAPGKLSEAMAAAGADLAALMLTHVNYRTGRMHDMAELTAQAHAQGALAIWDLSHSAGAMALDLQRCGVDLAVGCGYKYLNGGPGAPAFVYVARRHLAELRQPLTGWLGHARPFDFAEEYEPEPGILRMMAGTPPILALVALEAALDVFAEVDMAAVRAKSVALGDLFIRLVSELDGFGLASPRDGALRGSQVSITHPEGYAIMQALIARGVIGDFRPPDILRFGFAPLYVGYADVWDAVAILREVMQQRAWDIPEFAAKKAVT